MAGKRGRSGRPKGKTSARQLEQQRAAARKPRFGVRSAGTRNRQGERVKAAIREALKLEIIELYKGPILKRQIEIALGDHGATPGDATRAASFIGDRFGFPVRTVQDVNAEVRQAPLIEFRQTAFERPGSITVEGIHTADTNGHTNGNGNGKAHRVAAGSPGDHPGS